MGLVAKHTEVEPISILFGTTCSYVWFKRCKTTMAAPQDVSIAAIASVLLDLESRFH